MNLKILPQVLGRIKGGLYHVGANPSRDWLLLIVGFVLLILASVLWNGYFFLSASRGADLSAQSAEDNTPITTKLDAVRVLSEERALEEGRYRSEYRFVDPSR